MPKLISHQAHGVNKFINPRGLTPFTLIILAVFSNDDGTRRNTRSYSPPLTTQYPETATTYSPATTPSQQLASQNAPKSSLPSIQGIPKSSESESGTAPGLDLAGKSAAISSRIPEQSFSQSSKHDGGYFTVGSSKNEVLSVQGTPTKFTDTTFSYGSSDVIFIDGRVVSWTQYSMDPLKAKLLPSTRIAAKEFFTAGSTKDEVLAVQGTPTKFTDTTFSYGSSDVIFANGRVVSWTQYSMNPLKVR